VAQSPGLLSYEDDRRGTQFGKRRKEKKKRKEKTEEEKKITFFPLSCP
jgi:hypothetical protein